ncbi:ParA family protein [Mycobacterium sp. SMC-17]|uniref:ParA family protein n=1 Tax=Mycobacterium sp. SMC-17 TaxID=3381628 RepID=UPI0038773A25
MDTIAFFNHKGGVGKTTMLFNTAIEMHRLGKRVLMVDYDAQANLTAISLTDEVLEHLYSQPRQTVADAFQPLVGGAGDVDVPDPHVVRENGVWLAAGDLGLTEFEGIMPNAWTESLAGNERGFRVTSAPYRLIQQMGASVDADYAFVDLGPNVGALNRAVLLASDYLIVPLAADLFSLRALPSVGGSLETWVRQWATALTNCPQGLSFDIPLGLPKTLGYVRQQFNIYRGEATRAFKNWIAQMPSAFHDGLLVPLTPFRDGTGTDATLADPALQQGAELGDLKNYHSLVPYAQTMRQAIFELRSDHVIFGDQHKKALASEADFRSLCEHILVRTGQELPEREPA